MKARKIIWDKNKDEVLQKTRGIGFEIIAKKIQKNEIIKVLKNPSSKHKNQYIIVFKYNEYAWTSPCIITENEIILKTAFPSRKINKIIL